MPHLYIVPPANPDGSPVVPHKREMNAEEIAIVRARLKPVKEPLPDGVTLDDFNAYMPMHNYIFGPSLDPWPGVSVDARIPPQPLLDGYGNPVIKDGVEQTIKASAWLDRNKPVVQMTWIPGEPAIVEGKLTSEGGWIIRPGVRVLNLYRPAVITRGNPHHAGLWIEHIRNVYGDDEPHIVRWLAHRVQRPQEKLNHALVLGGPQGVGKDTLLEPLKDAIGPWNFKEASPTQIMGRFNDFVMSVVLRISEARDLGDVDRYAFYDKTKTLIASPPDVLRVDQKHLREFSVFNVCGVIITSNHKAGGIFLPPDDRRHYVAWTNLTKEDFDEDYWSRLWNWYDQRGRNNVAAYLRDLDISEFNPKAPPPKTAAWHEIVSSSRAPEESELADALDKIGNPSVTTLDEIISAAYGTTFAEFLADRKNRTKIPHRLEACGYVPVRNGDAKDGLWKIDGRRQAVYARKELSIRDQLGAARHRYG